MASPSGGVVKGAPQPELKPFKLGNLNSSSAGSIAMEPDGSMVAVYDIQSGAGKTVVCVLDRGKSACADKPLLTPLDNDSTFDTPEVFIPSANHVYVLQSTCCDSSTSGDNLLYASTDGGKTFGAPVRVGGQVAVNAAALVGNNIVFSEGDQRSGQMIQSVSLSSPGPPPSSANPITKTAYDIGVGDYHNGALVGSDFDGATFDTTYVTYARAGSDFNSTSSYTTVGTFTRESLLGMSGAALLTEQGTAHNPALLRLFNGSGFSAARTVPGTAGGGPEWFAVEQDPSGAVHVFSERGLASPSYDLIEESTSNGGKTWTRADLGNGINDNGFAAALDSHGTGLVLGTGDPLAYPVLANQGVSLSLSKSSIRKGQTITASGRVTPHDSGRSVQLQVEVGKNTWRNVTGAKATTKSGGSFSIKIKGNSAGSFTYRAVASDLAGYLLYGYSNGKSLHVTS
jgi:hypothetical protein